MKRWLLLFALLLVLVAFCADSCYDMPNNPNGWNGQYSVDGTHTGTIINMSGDGTPGHCPGESYSGGVGWHLIAGTCH